MAAGNRLRQPRILDLYPDFEYKRLCEYFVMGKKIDNSVIEGDGDAACPLGPARVKIGSPRLRRTSVRVRPFERGSKAMKFVKIAGSSYNLEH
eukprot:SAG11_NODE_4066_length_2081_cov_4.470737_2_plen_93_part_00